MDALMAALVAGALAQAGDRFAWLAAILADRYRPAPVILAAVLALALASGLAVAASFLLVPLLTPAARQLMVALALLLQGGGAAFPVKAPDRLSGWRLGAFATGLLGLFVLAFGDGLQFIVLALAVRSPVPALAAVGATLGSLAVVAPAALMGEAGWTALPLKRLRLGAGVFFVLTGLAMGLGALGLV